MMGEVTEGGNESTIDIWVARVAVVLTCGGALAAVVALPPASHEPGPPGILEIDEPVPAGVALRSAETPSARPERPPLDKASRQLVDAFDTKWKQVMVSSDPRFERSIMGHAGQALMQAGRFLEFVEVLETVYRTATVVDGLAVHLPRPARSAVERRAERLYGVAANLVPARWQIGAFDAADELSRELVRRAPDHPDVQMVRALVLQRRQDMSAPVAHELRRTLRRVLELDPTYSNFQHDPAAIRQQIGAIDARFGPPPRRAAPLADDGAAAPSDRGTPGERAGAVVDALVQSGVAAALEGGGETRDGLSEDD